MNYFHICNWSCKNNISGVKRGNGLVTPDYTSTYVFQNDFPALLQDVPTPPSPPGSFLE